MKKLAKNAILSLITFLGILIYFNMIFQTSSYNMLLTLLYFAILYFYMKCDIAFEKKTQWYSFILSFLISLMLTIGSIVSRYTFEPAMNIFGIRNIFYCIVGTCGLFFLFYRVFGKLFQKLEKFEITEEHPKMSKKYFLLMILAILAGYSIYFVRFFPAIMTMDSFYVLHYANNFVLSDFHPFGHTWFVGIFFHLGKFLFQDMNLALGLSTFVQMVCMVVIFATGIRYLYNKGVKKNICIGLVLIYALNPLYAHYSITLWRDVMFGGVFVLLLICLYEFVQNQEQKIKKRYIALFTVATLIMLFFRNNGIYVFLFMTPFMIVMLNKKRLLASILCGTIIVFYFVVKGPVFSLFHIEKTKSVEAFSIPLQQIARVIASGREIEGENREFLEKLFDYDQVESKYSSAISDPIKNITNNDVLSQNKVQFFKTYLSLLLKYPNVYVEAYFLQTLGYWYPDVIYWATAGTIGEPVFEEEQVATQDFTPEWYNKIIDTTTKREIPLCNLIWSVALPFMVLLVSSFMVCYMGKKKYLLCFVPLYGLWLSIMVATPVYSELRYVYGLFTCMPLVVLIGLKKEKEIEHETE